MIARSAVILPALLIFAVGIQILRMRATEPYFNGDETRHVMTGIFVHDAILDGAWAQPRAYAERYYAQYPCLGLMVWPPGFYLVEGLAMLVFGPTFETGRGVVIGYLLVAVFYGFLLVKRTHGETTATISILLLIVSREVFIHSRAVMLEVPTLACVLAAIHYFERYLSSRNRADLIAFSIATILAGFHRYDAVFLAPLLLARIGISGDLRLLRTRAALASSSAIILALAPVYAFAFAAVGQQHAISAGSGTNPAVTRVGIERLTYYPSGLEFQLGLVAAIVGAGGLVLSFRRIARAASRPYWTWLAVVYGFFAFFPEQETRHTIYWLPVWCVFAAEAALVPFRAYGSRTIAGVFVIAILGHAACWTLRQPVPWVRGYADAAAYALARTEGPGIVLFDGHFDGTFIYGVRSQDRERRLWIARGDKLLYAMRSDPGAEYVEWKKTEREIVETLVLLAPDFVVVEEPPLKYRLPAQAALRNILKNRSDLFAIAEHFEIRNHNIEWMDGSRLVVYRYRHRVDGPRRLNIPMLWGGRDLSVDVGNR